MDFKISGTVDVALSALGFNDRGVRMFVGIDPGRDKVGWALANEDAELLMSGIFRASEAPSFFNELAKGDSSYMESFALEKRLEEHMRITPFTLLMGDGTGKELLLSLAQSASLRVKLVSERGTTLLARKLYWELHPPRGLWRLVSRSIRLPARDIDDLAAWAIVLRYCAVQPEEKMERKREGWN